MADSRFPFGWLQRQVVRSAAAAARIPVGLGGTGPKFAERDQALNSAVKLLEYALHLRMYGENAPGGNETWAQFDRDCEHFLRTTGS